MKAFKMVQLFTFLQLAILPLASSQHPSFDFASLVNYPDSPNTSTSYQAPRPLKFGKWNSFQEPLRFTSEYVCNVTLLAYKGSIPAREELGQVSSYCNAHLDCVLGSISETIKADIGSASVLLGLTPGLLACIGPTVAEISLLSLRRPVLALLISLGSPVIYPSQVARYEDPFSLYESHTGALAVPRIRQPYSVIVSASQYLLAMGAAANVWKVSYDIGIGSVISWWCTSSFVPLIWTSLTIGIYLLAASGLHIRKILSNRSQTPQPAMRKITAYGWFKGFVSQETMLSGNDPEPREPQDDSFLGYGPLVLHLMAGWLAIWHIAFGTAVFSGLLFININFGAKVLGRYMASATICRLLLSFEIGGMRNLPEERLNGWIVQPKTQMK